METEDLRRPDALLRRLTLPVTAAVAGVVAAAWYVTWTASGTIMMLTAPATLGSTDLVLFFALLNVMMVAMMLPSALPMALAYHGMTRLEGGQPVRSADTIGTLMFLIPYVLVWGAFGVAALLALVALGLMGSMLTGPLLYVPAAILVAAGAWQVTRTKEVCLSHCTSPAGFVLHHWRSGRIGALRMGFRHSLYCIGCCWLFMLVLFISGSMSLVWMGGLSIGIFAEKLGVQTSLFRRVIGVILVALGSLVALAAGLAK
jgi:predicted metal-binding membrane protein